MIIDNTYFNGEINIPNATKFEVSNNINLFIAEKEPECLIKLLGWELYNAMANNLTEDRFAKLLNGTTYTYNDRQYKWQGLKYSQDGHKFSIIANYVFFYWHRNNRTYTSGVGEQSTDVDNGHKTDGSIRGIAVWNKVAFWAKDCYRFLKANELVYPEFTTDIERCSEFRVANYLNF